MHARRRGLTVLELLIIIVVIVVAAVLLLRMRGRESGPAPVAADSSNVLAPPAGAGNQLTTKLDFLAPLDSTARVGDTVTVRVRASTDAGTAVRSATIDLAVTAGEGRLSTTSAVTRDDGEAEARWVLGAQPGAQTVRASVQGNESAAATLTVTAVARPAGAP